MKRIIFILIILLVSSNVYSKEWYEGGTLHKASAIDWQNATFENKLATCSDFVSTTWQNHKFKPEIQSQITSMESIKVISIKLVNAVDIALKKENNPELNKKVYSNQSITSVVAILMINMGWIKP